MRILIVHKYYYDRGGDAIYARALERSLVAQGHEVAFFAMQHAQNVQSPWERYFVSNLDFERRDSGFRAVRNSIDQATRVLYSREAATNTARIVADFRPDIAHIHGLHSQLSASVLRTLAECGVPSVWTLHDYKVVCPAYTLLRDGQICERCRGERFHECALHRCLKRSYAASIGGSLEAWVFKLLGIYSTVGAFISPSRFLARKIEEMGFRQRIEIIPCFLEAVDQAIQLPARGSDALFVGRLSPEKGVRVLLDAMALVPDVRLDVIGDGPDRHELEGYAARRGLQNVQFVGWGNRERVHAAIREHGFVVVPSVWYENLPLVALEAFGAGRPIVASELGGLVELVGGSARGCLCRPSDPAGLAEAISAMARSPQLREEKGAAAWRYARTEFSRSDHLASLECLYGEVIASFPRRGGRRQFTD